MSYIGKEPSIGNFVKLDAISTSSTNTYNLTLDSVAFSPESPNHCLVSLNGVIQSPSTSFSISGSTITFIPSSGTLSSSDSIDFIMVYGNVLDLGVPSDATVTNAKTNFVSTSSAAGLQIKGDGTTDGTLQLNCSQNSHGIKLKSPAHSASASYTLTFPTTDGSADEFLKTDGSGVLSWASAGGNTPNFHAYQNATQGTVLTQNTYTKVVFDSEYYDSDNALATGRFTVPSGGAGKYFFSSTITMNIALAEINMYLYKNGSAFIRGGAMNSNIGSTQMVSGSMNLSVGDYVEVYVRQNQSSNRVEGVTSGSSHSSFNGFKIA